MTILSTARETIAKITGRSETGYANVVARTARGEKLSLESVQEALMAAGKSGTDFERDVGRTVERLAGVAEVSQAAQVSKAIIDAEKQLSKLRSDFSKAQEAFEAAEIPLENLLTNLNERQGKIATIRGQLIAQCPDDALRARHTALTGRMQDLTKKLARMAERSEQIKGALSTPRAIANLLLPEGAEDKRLQARQITLHENAKALEAELAKGKAELAKLQAERSEVENLMAAAV